MEIMHDQSAKDLKNEDTEDKQVGKKRRGRRKIHHDQYYAMTNDKI
jgi:hypothetical protein